MRNYSLSSAGHNIFGQAFNEPLTAREALSECGADFEVALQPIIVANKQLSSLLNGTMAFNTADTQIINGKQYVSIDMLKQSMLSDYKSTMRMDTETSLGIVGNNYTTIQNHVAFDYLDLLTSGELGTKLDITNAGSLLGGRRVYVQAKFPEPIRMAGNNNDIIDLYITLSTSHDGSSSCQVAICGVRAACLNSLNYAIKHCVSKITFKHTTNVESRMDLFQKQNAEMAYKTLGLYETYKQFFEQSLSNLAKIRLTEKQMEALLVHSVLPEDAIKVYSRTNTLDTDEISTRARNIVNGILDANEYGIGQDIITEKNTGLSLVNALTTYYQNDVEWKDNERKYLALTEGSVQTKLQKLYDNLNAIKVA